MDAIHISIVPEKVLEIGNNIVITNSMLGSIVVWIVLMFFGVLVKMNLKVKGPPSKLQNMVESLYILLENMARDVLGAKRARKYLGLVITAFCFILFGSWLGLLPGILQLTITEHTSHGDVLVPIFRAPTTDLNATIALAIIAFFTIEYAGFSELGLGYLKKFFQIKHGLLNTFIGLLELLSELTRLLSFSFRLFGNIFAGEVLLVVLAVLSRGVPISSVVILMEFFVAIIQSYVFVNLMSIYVSMAAQPAEH